MEKADIIVEKRLWKKGSAIDPHYMLFVWSCGDPRKEYRMTQTDGHTARHPNSKVCLKQHADQLTRDRMVDDQKRFTHPTVAKWLVVI